MKKQQSDESKIDRYIAATRVNHPGRILTDLYYKHYFPPIEALATMLGVAVQLRVVYSSTRRAENVTIGNDHWLVYDQYMGQTLNILNRIFLEAEGEGAGIAYSHKILAEHLLEIGRKPEALFCARVYDSERHALGPKGGTKSLPQLEFRSLFTETQERFYLVHEMGHRVYILEHPSCVIVRQRATELLAERYLESETATFDAVLDRFKSGPPAAYHHAALDEIETDMREHFEGQRGISYRSAYSKAFENPDLHQEVFCDLLAADATAGKHPELESVLRGIYVGFYHLQVLALVNRYFGVDAEGADEWIEHFVPIQIRAHCLRRHLIFLLELVLTHKGAEVESVIATKVNEFSIQLMEDQRRCYDTILDPAMKTMGFLRQHGQLAQLSRDDLARLLASHPELADPSAALELDIALEISVRLLTGWLKSKLDLDVGLQA
jgi:hypothetical protein